MRNSIKDLTEIQKYCIHYLLFILQVCDFITEDQITKAGLSLNEPMLTVTDNNLFFNYVVITPNITFGLDSSLAVSLLVDSRKKDPKNADQ